MKKSMSLILCLALFMVFVVAPSNINANSVGLEEPVVRVTTHYDPETGEVIGETKAETSVKVSENKDGTKNIVIVTDVKTTHVDGTIEEYQNIDEILYVDESEAYINGAAVDMDQEIKLSDYENNYGIMGGVSYLTSYTQENFPGYGWFAGYTMKAYPYVSGGGTTLSGIFMDPGTGGGTQITKYNWLNHSQYSSEVRIFMLYADQVATARNNISINVPILLTQLGVAAITVGTLLGLIGSAVAAGITATVIWNDSVAGRNAVENAYDVLNDEIVSGVR